MTDPEAFVMRTPVKKCWPKTTPAFVLVGFALWILLVSLTCTVDHGLAPIFSKIGGRIFFSGEAPDNSDEVRVAVAKDFPPRRVNELLFSDRIPFRDEDTVAYELYLPEGQYDLVAVFWKEKKQSWNISDIVGLYGGTFVGDLLVIPAIKPVTIPTEDAVVDTIDIQVNLNRVNRDAAVEGTIAFEGTWPENTGALGVGAFIEIPERGNYLDYYIKSVYIDYGVATFVNEDDYLLRVHSGDTLAYIAVLWIDDSFDLSSIREIGFYRDPQDPSQPGVVWVGEGSHLRDIDITVDFSEM